ncbi:hypothetical protein FQA39_LY01585 [Lamprigera yunnana]|nr:hypothetical protein FQA39_LY01585 [Lamprigera yunnana]
MSHSQPKRVRPSDPNFEKVVLEWFNAESEGDDDSADSDGDAICSEHSSDSEVSSLSSQDETFGGTTKSSGEIIDNYFVFNVITYFMLRLSRKILAGSHVVDSEIPLDIKFQQSLKLYNNKVNKINFYFILDNPKLTCDASTSHNAQAPQRHVLSEDARKNQLDNNVLFCYISLQSYRQDFGHSCQATGVSKSAVIRILKRGRAIECGEKLTFANATPIPKLSPKSSVDSW